MTARNVDNYMVLPEFKDEPEQDEDREYEIRRQQSIDDSRTVSTPDASKINSDPAYLRQLIRKTGLTQEVVAERLGIGGRRLRYYLTVDDGPDAPYTVQYALERLAAAATDPVFRRQAD